MAIARRLREGEPAAGIDIPGTARVWTRLPAEKNCLELPPCEEVQADPAKLLQSQLQIGQAGGKRALAQKHANRWVVQNPAERYGSPDLDFIYGLGYRRRHANASGYSPALRMNLFSVTSHRGCAGGCAFCSITLSEGRRVVSRSPESVLREIALPGRPSGMARRGFRYRRAYRRDVRQRLSNGWLPARFLPAARDLPATSAPVNPTATCCAAAGACRE